MILCSKICSKLILTSEMILSNDNKYLLTNSCHLTVQLSEYYEHSSVRPINVCYKRYLILIMVD